MHCSGVSSVPASHVPPAPRSSSCSDAAIVAFTRGIFTLLSTLCFAGAAFGATWLIIPAMAFALLAIFGRVSSSVTYHRSTSPSYSSWSIPVVWSAPFRYFREVTVVRPAPSLFPAGRKSHPPASLVRASNPLREASYDSRPAPSPFPAGRESHPSAPSVRASNPLREASHNSMPLGTSRPAAASSNPRAGNPSRR